MWVIRDGPRKISTSCAAEDREGAERALGEHLADKYRPNRTRGRHPSEILIADVLAIYLNDVAPRHARENETKQRVLTLDAWWGDRTLADINGSNCRAYADYRTAQPWKAAKPHQTGIVPRMVSAAAARRELEDLRAAINHHRREGLCSEVVSVVLPPRPPARQRWLTRPEAARLLWAAWRAKQVMRDNDTRRAVGRHVARFILVALYTGTRSSAICRAALHAPDIQRLLPPHYTTMYSVTLLTDEELKQAIAEKVLHPDMQRVQLERWRKSHCEKVVVAPIPIEAESDSAVASPPIALTQDAVEGGALRSTMSDDNLNSQEQLAVAPEDAPAPGAVATGAVVAGPLTPQPSDEEIPPFLDRRPMSAEDQRVFDVIMAAYSIASPVVRERVRAEIIGADAPVAEASWRDDDVSAISSTTPSPPTMSEPLAQTADAAALAEAEKSDLPKGTPPNLIPQAVDGADGGIKNQSVEFVSHRIIGGRPISVLRHRRHGKAKKQRG